MQFVQAPTLPLLSGSWLDSLQIFLVISSAMSLTLICTPIWRGTERSKLRYQAGKTGLLACFRRSDSHGARPKSESRKKEGRREGEGGGGVCPGVVLRKYASFNVTLNYVMHKIMEFCVTPSLALDNWRKYCQTLGNKPNHSHRLLRGRLFSKGKILNYLIVCFT